MAYDSSDQFVIMHGVCLGVGNNWPRLYFILFYFVAINIAFNTLVSVFLAITSSGEGGAMEQKPMHTIAITKLVENSEDNEDATESSDNRDDAAEDVRCQTFTVQAFRRARSHSLLFEIMAST